MDAYAQALNYAIPFFTILMLIEFIASKVMGRSDVIYPIDTISSLSSGLTNIIKDVLQLTIPILAYAWLVDKLTIEAISVENVYVAVAIVFVFGDFVGYWVHRLEHTVNYFWNRHVIHHSSEEFNLACALRQSISEFTTITAVLLIPLALLGISAEIFATVAAVRLFMQFWYHTRLIGKMGFLEKFLVTPSHHRVHHAINDEYMDKNYGQIFIIWDKMFGTFQEEQDDKPPVYGIKRAAKTWNPVLINYQHLWLLIKDTWRTKSFKDKFRVWFMPTGWRPADVEEKYPVEYTKDAYKQEKYRPGASVGLTLWSIVQFVVSLVLMVFLFNQLGEIGIPSIYIYGLFLVFSIFTYSMAMDKSKHSWWLEIVKSIIGLALVYVYDGWFTMGEIWSLGNYLVIGYFVISPIIVLLFHFAEFRKTNKTQDLTVA